ncbi:MAG: hypothetical protein ABI091_24320, partial [Ferruginibacter sp.]
LPMLTEAQAADAGMTAYMVGTGYEGHYEASKQIIGTKPEDEWKRNLYALANGYIDKAVFDVLPVAEIGSAVYGGARKEAAAGFDNVLKNSTLQSIDREALSTWVDKTIKGTLNTIGETSKIGAAQVLGTSAKQVVNSILGDPEKAKEELTNNYVDEVKAGLMSLPFSMMIPLGAAEVLKSRSHSNMFRQGLYDVGSKPETYSSGLSDLLSENKVTPDQVNAKMKVVNTLKDIVNSLPENSPTTGQPLNMNERVQYTYNRLKEIALKNQAENPNIKNDESLYNGYQKQIKDIQAQKEDILAGNQKENTFEPNTALVSVIAPKTQVEIDSALPTVSTPSPENVPTENAKVSVVLPETIAREQQNKIIIPNENTQTEIPVTPTETSPANEGANQTVQPTETAKAEPNRFEKATIAKEVSDNIDQVKIPAYKEALSGDPKDVYNTLKDVADQANGSEGELKGAINTYGQKIVDIAQREFPNQKVAPTKGISDFESSLKGNESVSNTTPIEGKEKQISLKSIKPEYKVGNETFNESSIHDESGNKIGEVNVQSDKKGNIVRNVFLEDNAKNQGYGKSLYRDLNKKSIEETGNPLRSSNADRELKSGEKLRTRTDDANRLWDSLVKSVEAEKVDDNTYKFKQPEPTEVNTKHTNESNNTGTTKGIDTPIQSNDIKPQVKEDKGAAQKSTDAVGQGNAETGTSLLDSKSEKVVNSKIPNDSKTIRGMFKEPSNWDNNETLTWKEFIDKNISNGDLSLFKETSKTYKKDALFPSGEKDGYFLTIDQKNKRTIPKEVYDYFNSKKINTNETKSSNKEQATTGNIGESNGKSLFDILDTKVGKNDPLKADKSVIKEIIQEGVDNNKNVELADIIKEAKDKGGYTDKQLEDLTTAYHELVKESGFEGEGNVSDLTSPIAKNLNKTVSILFGKKDNYIEVAKNSAEVEKMAKESNNARFDKSNAVFETRDGDAIGYNYDTDKVARERFDISKLKKIGSGSDRDVYDLGDGKVLKVAKTARGLTQNVSEGDGMLSGSIIPEAHERGLNYVVVDNAPRIKSSDIVDTYNLETGVEDGKTTAGQMIKDFAPFTQRDFDNHKDALQEVLRKYGFDDIRSYDVLWNDWKAQRNWGYKDGKALHSDAGTFGGVDMIDSHKGKTNLSDPEFRDIYNKSKALKKQFMDSDKNTMYMKDDAGKILGFVDPKTGKIVLNGESLNPNTPIHEVSHLFTEWTKQNNKPVYDRGIELITPSKYLRDVSANEFYKKEALKAGKEGSPEYKEYLQHEALAKAIGDKGAQFITEAKRKSFAEWAKSLWESIGAKLGFKGVTAEELSNMKLDEFTSRAAKDILSGEPAKGEVKDLINDKVYDDFIDKNKVPDDILKSIAEKVKSNEILSERENAIFHGKTSEINDIISGKVKEPPPIEQNIPNEEANQKPFTPIDQANITEEGKKLKSEQLTGAVKWNESVDKGISELMNERKASESVTDVAARKVNDWVSKLTAEHSKDGKYTFNPSDTEIAQLAFYRTKINESIADIDLTDKTQGVILDRLENELHKTDFVLDKSATAAGRAFYIRQMVSRLDSENGLEVRRKLLEKKNGEPLSSEDEDSLRKNYAAEQS